MWKKPFIVKGNQIKLSKEGVDKTSQDEAELQERHNPIKPTISCSDSVLVFVKKIPNSNSGILIDVKKTQEACVFAAEVDVKIIERFPEEETISATIELPELERRPIFITKEFKHFFGKYAHLELALKGMIRKKIVCTNIKPYIKNVCKV